ncbi:MULTISPECIES: glycosyltransferase family 2 protein [Agromyces]|uniref:Dolichol-phosphate mannosyltransferase n=1 Tax=Agromyces mediolanus TaxID=41986 RepID=A0A918CP49_AGRME|nr:MULTISPECIES: glycosyltransferase family 2 protein [Agromyces]GGR34462.1 dolichol-phosphate mannosyltransferase [Agromyces mediolanus]GLJ74114.1 dolichol-phosphate mannosyltransferase [Agromyces mediolanus]GLU90646.1 dolichol-phosphate mannosyltransferase [Agromyces sp. NBRC 114283]
MTERKKIAYVFPIYNERGNIEVLYRTLVEELKRIESRYTFEFVFVDDGSKDDSLELLLELREQDPRVTVLSFARNYGHQMAVTAGIDYAEADAVVIMDSDLQDPPAVSIQLIERWESGADVVYAQRRTRKDTAFKRTTAHAFYWALSKLASIEIPRNTGDFRLLDRRVVAELRKYREHNRFLRGLVSYVGFRQEAVLFDRDARLSGETGYPLRKMMKFAADGILGFSTVPLQLISRVGLAISALAFLGIIYSVTVRLVAPETTVPGWAFVTVAMFLLGGIQLTMLGVLGSYVGRIYVEVQHRPLYSFALVAGGTEGRDDRTETVRRIG